MGIITLIIASIFCFFAGIYGWGEPKLDPLDQARVDALKKHQQQLSEKWQREHNPPTQES